MMSTNPTPVSKGKRGRDDDRNELPTSFLPKHNPLARKAYICANIGLIPVVGLALGPCAIALGILGLRAFRRDRNIKGGNHAVVSMILGTLEIVINIVGLTMIATGMGWISPD